MLSMARLILAYNPLTTSYDSVCRLISTPLKWVILRRLVIKNANKNLSPNFGRK